MLSWRSTSDRTLVQSNPVHPYGRQRSTSSCQGGCGEHPAGDQRPYRLASMLIWSQPDRACLKHATGGDFAMSTPTNDSRGTWKCPNWRVEQSWDGSRPETHWKHDTPLPDCDCTTRVTHDLLPVVDSSIWRVLDMFMTWSNIVKLQFMGV